MCGIFGLIGNKQKLSFRVFKSMADDLFRLSESRGKDASGLAVISTDQISVFKKAVSASKFIHLQKYNYLMNKVFLNSSQKQTIGLIGHARMVTNGALEESNNNQPIVKDCLIAIHNGIIVNDKDLWRKFPMLKREYEVDTEIFLSLMRYFLKKTNSITESLKKTYSLIEGAASIALFFEDFNYMLFATNTGSLYFVRNDEKNILIFASERYFLEKLFRNKKRERLMNWHKIIKVEPGTGQIINLDTLEMQEINFRKEIESKKTYKTTRRKVENVTDGEEKNKRITIININNNKKTEIRKIIKSSYEKTKKEVDKLRRCSKCILPETMPFIQFDENGICNYCRNYIKKEVLGKKKLEEIIWKYRDKNGKPDCIVTFSGGRDSSFGLHYIRNILKMNPVAYSYDWGMLTDLGRRNQSRMTAELGIEHILISADIQKKREYIRKNVEAWLKKPDLGTVPLFMAGDKQYFYYANELKKQMGIKLVFLCDNPFEKTDFKFGYCGIQQKQVGEKKSYRLSFTASLSMIFYYAKQFLSNPSYMNSSLFDTAWAFASYYFIPHEFVSLYNYVRWDKKIVESKLEKYDWERAKDTLSTWRIGDGTTAFYNYIYYMLAGFSENDTFKSNQIREGMMTRKEAIKIVEEDNKIRIDSLFWYLNTIAVDFKQVVIAINKAKKLYL